MRRRELLAVAGGALAAATWSRCALTQPPGLPLVFVLSPQSSAAAASHIQALRDGLRDLGYSEGRNLAMEFRFADGAVERLPALAAELVARRPAVIVAGSLPAIMAAQNATRSIPIIMSATVQDPMAAGLAASMAQPGGNVTGFWAEGDGGLISKRLELLKEAVPGTSRVAVFVNPNDSDIANTLSLLPEISNTLGFKFNVIEVRSAGDFAAAFAAAQRERVQALYVSQTPLLFSNRVEITAMALRARLPSISGYGDFATAGGLLSYATNLPDIYRRSASFVDKVLKGAHAGQLPIERPVKFELIVNLRTAKALGLPISEAFLVRADEVIE